jgi:hypothetical protein
MGERDHMEMAATLVDVIAHFTPMREAVIGYRTQLLAAGFSESEAGEMAVQFHGVLMSAAAHAAQSTVRGVS